MKIEENDCIRQTLRQAMPDDLPVAVADRMRSRLAAFRQRFDEEPLPQLGRITQWIGGLTIGQRIATFASVGVAAILGFLLLWGVIAAIPASAMEKMAESIRKVKSWKCTQIVQEPNLQSKAVKPGERPGKAETSYTVYWFAPRSTRFEYTHSPEWKGPGPETSRIFSLQGSRAFTSITVTRHSIVPRPSSLVMVLRAVSCLKTWEGYPARLTVN